MSGVRMWRGAGRVQMRTAGAERGGERIRSFVAVDIDPSVLEAARRLQAELATCGADVRWVRPAAMHLTLKFLGPVAPAHLERVHAAVRDAVHDIPALAISARGLGAFPSLQRPRVVWAGLAGDGLAELAARVEAALVPLGFAAEVRGFTPHVTLGRVGSLRGWPRLAEVLEVRRDDEFGPTAVRAVTIYRSTLHPEGAQYAVLWTIPLGEHKKENPDGNGR